MFFLVLALLSLVALFWLPGAWAKAVLRRHSAPREDCPGRGGEFARHLLDRHGLTGVAVEITDQGDHYAPAERAVRLSRENFEGRSLTAVTVAAHEVGHALQHHEAYAPLETRTRLVQAAQRMEKIGAVVMLLMPLVAIGSRSPLGAGAMALAGGLSFCLAALVHLATLPVELDASFRRALPLLSTDYLSRRDLRPARHILTACAFTYVAASLAAALNLWRWLAILRR